MRAADAASGSGLLGSQIAEQPVKRLPDSVVLFPVGEVRDEILPHLLRQILTGVGVEASPRFNFLELHDANREQLAPALSNLRLPRPLNLVHHPLALHAALRQDEEQPVVQLNGPLYLLIKLLPTLHLTRRQPHPQLLIPHPRVKPPRELFVPRAVADEAGIKLYRLLYAEVRRDEGYEIVRHAAAAQEHFGYLPARFIE